ncbi:MAG: hypothetical protein JEZ05_10450 [Tenericutes bacterium]|nr:hypothetical protein [Mycoplasmatota bacterium]
MKSITFTEIEKFRYTLEIKDKMHTLSKEELLETSIVFFKGLLEKTQMCTKAFDYFKKIAVFKQSTDEIHKTIDRIGII